MVPLKQEVIDIMTRAWQQASCDVASQLDPLIHGLPDRAEPRCKDLWVFEICPGSLTVFHPPLQENATSAENCKLTDCDQSRYSTPDSGFCCAIRGDLNRGTGRERNSCVVAFSQGLQASEGSTQRNKCPRTNQAELIRVSHVLYLYSTQHLRVAQTRRVSNVTIRGSGTRASKLN
ncbi:hypothetical protein JZ751_023503 [Albula glossodonta]|uniref:Uncharacterized protein n=1 Tax=Albula glossodonta TaxID=121402 RepID=A0A8T2NPS9_9TELE|nr:hypothetical protein JZ751_023503 [Albula glossodonta]